MLAALLALALAAGDITGAVTDSANGKPLPGADVLLSQNGQLVARTSTDDFGRYRIHDLAVGTYQLEVRLIGFRPAAKQIEITQRGGEVEVVFQMTAAPVQLQTIEVSGAPVAVDTRTGNQVFKQDEFQGSPTLTTSQIVQQAIAGAARAPTGEVHIRGQHAEFTYYVDGIPVPPGISGSLNELFDPSIVNQITFQTGSWDAEYGLRNAAIVNITTRVPAGPFHADLSSYAGSFASNGQTVALSGNSGKLGLFFSGTRQATDLRRESVVADTDAAGNITAIRNYANHGNDLFGFGKATYSPTDHDVVNLDVNWSRSRFQTPFDSSVAIINDEEQDVNGFVNLGWRHRVSSGRTAGSELFAGAFYRHGSLTYVPGASDQPSFAFAPDTTLYNISEDRSFNIVGVKLDYLLRLSEQLSFKAGTQSSLVRGHENFQSFAAGGTPGPASDSPLNGNDVGVYVQSQIAPSEKWELRTGIRFDNHNFPITPTQNASAHQFSPRVRLTFFPDPSTTIWAYYGRLFLPTNTEDLRAITSAGTGGVATEPTVPERDHFFEVGLTHRFPFGLVAKLSAYHKRSSPGIDDTQVPGTSITTDVNIEQVRITGLETVLEIRPPGPITGFVNLAIAHAYGFGAVSGGFFPVAPPTQTFDLDHDQRLSATAGLTYSGQGLLVTATGIYGSGLTNGLTPNTPGVAGFDATLPSTGSLGTGLFDFNKEFKVDPSFILNASAGYTFALGGVLLRPQVYVDNVFDKLYLLKGAFFSGTTFGRPRTFQVRLNLGV
ncbi:MAG TPA: TonB-dependent receptor [Gemmatimonadales bacterium]|nr:TonB-dependent receptor [Gemmatimonadales bacterium]